MAWLAMLDKRSPGPEHRILLLVPTVPLSLESIRKAEADCNTL